VDKVRGRGQMVQAWGYGKATNVLPSGPRVKTDLYSGFKKRDSNPPDKEEPTEKNAAQNPFEKRVALFLSVVGRGR